MLHRQGDVWLVPVTSPATRDGTNEAFAEARTRARAQKRSRRIVVQRGEVTGHAHALQGAQMETLSIGGFQFVVAENPVRLVHDEHRAQVLDPTAYRILRQREFDPFAHERLVRD